MKLIYIAGPFRGANAWAIEQNIRRAEETAFMVWSAGFVAICPHTNTRFFEGALPDHMWLEGDLEILSRCDAMVLAPNWEHSRGTAAEIAFAQERGIRVFETVTELKAWGYVEDLKR